MPLPGTSFLSHAAYFITTESVQTRGDMQTRGPLGVDLGRDAAVRQWDSAAAGTAKDGSARLTARRSRRWRRRRLQCRSHGLRQEIRVWLVVQRLGPQEAPERAEVPPDLGSKEFRQLGRLLLEVPAQRQVDIEPAPYLPVIGEAAESLR